VVAFPLGDHGILVRLQGGVEGGSFVVRQGDPPGAGPLVAGLGDRPRRPWPRIGLGTRLELDRGAQLADRGAFGELGVVRIGAVGRPVRDDADLVRENRPSRIPSAQRGNSCSRCATLAIVLAFFDDVPIFQATNAATDHAPVAPHSSSRSISATMSTTRPSIALR
jgi:hypothetical protein